MIYFNKKHIKSLIILALLIIFVIFIFLNNFGLNSFRQRKIISQLDNYNVLEGYYGDIYYSEGYSSYARTIKRISDCYYTALQNDFSLENPKKLSIIIYPKSSELYKAIGIDYGTSPPMGVYYAGFIHILSPENWVEGDESFIAEVFIEEGPVIHEMAHFMLDAKTNGNYDPWFSEGCALFYEQKYTGFELQKGIITPDYHIGFGDIDELFSAEDELVAYKVSYEKIKDITSALGEEGLTEIYNSLERGKALDVVLGEILGGRGSEWVGD